MYFNESSEEVLKKLETNTSTGLSSEEVTERKSKYGLNKLASKKSKSKIQLFFSQLNNVLIYILIAAAVLSVIVAKEFSDALIIAIVILINAIVGMVQESKAEKALESLKALSAPHALVKRNGEIVEISSEDIVPGDIIIIDAGRYIPCDLRIIESANLKIEESALTGESVPVDKTADLIDDDDSIALGDKKNMAFMSTLVTYGRGTGVAVSTGMNTEIGKIASMLSTSDSELTPLQVKLEQLGKILGAACVGICIVIFAIGLFQGRSITDMLMISISLAVAAIPEGLSAIVTIVLALGVQRMIKKNAIIRKLPSVETLGAVNVICSDKTGTLTQNKMTVVQFYTDGMLKKVEDINLANFSDKLLVENLVLCNDATSTEGSRTGDPTEIALIDVGNKNGLTKESLNSLHERIKEIPFDSDRKLMTTVNRYENDLYVMTKGAIDHMFSVCTSALVNGKAVPLTEELKSSFMDISNQMSDEALRVLASAYKIIPINEPVDMDSLESELTFIGLVGMIDPPRLEVKASIEKCRNSGIKTIMITGDHKNTAFAIAKELSIADNISQVMSGSEIDSLSVEALADKCKYLRVFARVSPEHKVKIVKAFKADKNIVSMTGDGVNDAPSLKAADIGVAMGITGTDVAKGASDMILTDDNFSTIVSAIEEGRNIFNNIKKSVMFLISCNLGEIFTLFVAIMLGWAEPLNATHILWVNLITDSFPGLSLGVDPAESDVMKHNPRNPDDSLFKGSVLSIILNGALIACLTLIGFIYAVMRYGNSELSLATVESNPYILMHAQTIAFAVLSGAQLIHSLDMRSREQSIFKIGLFSNKYIIYSILLGLGLQVLVIYIPPVAALFNIVPLNVQDWIVVLGLSLIPLIVNEIVKAVKRLFIKTAA